MSAIPRREIAEVQRNFIHGQEREQTKIRKEFW